MTNSKPNKKKIEKIELADGFEKEFYKENTDVYIVQLQRKLNEIIEKLNI